MEYVSSLIASMALGGAAGVPLGPLPPPPAVTAKCSVSKAVKIVSPVAPVAPAAIDKVESFSMSALSTEGRRIRNGWSRAPLGSNACAMRSMARKAKGRLAAVKMTYRSRVGALPRTECG